MSSLPLFSSLLRDVGILNKSLLTHCDLSLQDSDGEKSDDNLVVDVSNEVYTMVFFLPDRNGSEGIFSSFCAYWFYEQDYGICLPKGT